MTAKHLAAGFSSSSVVNLILDENADVNVLEGVGDGYTPLHYTAQYNDVEVVSMLEDKGAGLWAGGKNRLTPVEVSARFNPSADVVKLLIKQTDNWDHLLLEAAEHNPSVEVVRMLINSGANAGPNGGHSALHMAAWYNPNASVIRALIEAGADVNDYDYAYRTPLHLAAMQWRTKMQT